MQLEYSTWCEVENYLKYRTDIIIPIGSTEQHGPMGLIGTDSICPEVLAEGISERKKVLIAPTIKFGMSQHHLSFPGTITLRPTTMISLIKDIVLSLTNHGFTHLFFLNGHGGNVASITTAFSEIYTEHSLNQKPSSTHFHLWNWYNGDRVKALSEASFKEAEGSHASPSELSLSFYAHPSAVKSVELPQELSSNTNFRDCFDFRNNFSDGRMGADSSLASIDIGKKLFDRAIEDILEIYEEFYQI
jgi:creatinine amidohydrolase